MGFTNKSILMKHFFQLAEKGLIKVYSIPWYREHLLLSKSELDLFLQEHISVRQALDFYKVHRNYFTSAGNIEVITFMSTYDGMYLNKKRLEIEMYNRGFGSTYTRPKAMEILDLAIDAFNRVIEEYDIPKLPVGFDKKDIDYLLEEQQRILNDIGQNYYSKDEVAQMIDSSSGIVSSKLNERLGRINIPSIARTNKGKYPLKSVPHNTSLYQKVKVDDYVKEKKVKNFIYKTPMTDPYLTFQALIKMAELEFSGFAKETEDIWFKYVKRKFSETRASESRINNYIVTCQNATVQLIALTKSKELYHCSEAELNLSIFNEYQFKNVKIEIHSFLFQWNKQAMKKIKSLFGT